MQVYKKFNYVSLEDAYNLIRNAITMQVKKEEVPVYNAYNRVLAEDIISRVNIPAASVSHFDGYAVKAEDTAKASVDNPFLLRVVGRSFLNKEFEGEVKNGETAYISTGCKLPIGADAVIPVELTKVNGEFIEVRHRVKPYENVIPAGADAKKGEKVFSSGLVLRAQDIKFLIDIKKWKVKVFKKPVVAIVSVGSELTDRIEEADERKFNSHGVMIPFLVNEVGGLSLNLGVAVDDVSDIKRLIKIALEKADISVTIGGASVGEMDYVLEAVNQMGTSKVLVRGIKVQPGRVTSVVMVENKPIVMLPGHVQSTLVGFYLILTPLIRFMSGLPLTIPYLKLKAKMARKIAVKEFPSFKRVRFVKVTETCGGYVANPVIGDSSLTRVVVESNGFIVLAEGKETVEEGEEVDVHLSHDSSSIWLGEDENP